MHSERWQGRCFTTIELLVIMAVLSILVSLLLPAIQKSRERVQRAVCVNTLKQHATVLFLYSEDESDNFPAPSLQTVQPPYWFAYYWRTVEHYYPMTGSFYGTAWQGRKDVYEKGVDVMGAYLCPAAVESYDAARPGLNSNVDYRARLDRRGSYVTANMWYTAHPATEDEMAAGRKMSNLPEASRYFFMNDTGFNDQTDDRSYSQWKTGQGKIDGGFRWAHSAGFGVGFLDGHGKYYRRKTRILSWFADYTRLLPDDMN
jgi:competence protein ComGC